MRFARWAVRAWAVGSMTGFIALMFVKTVTPGVVLLAGSDGIAMGLAIFAMTVEAR